ncbi:MAG: hypothetical protein JNN11_04690 [Candidatus Doudnabacteria bacterium]|nr:hypothetical protein [Candidatus Doudnabacteria bacterium]
MSEIKIKTKFGQKLYFFSLRILNQFLHFISLRRPRKFWGVVYDSVSKQPLDPVIVKLSYASGEPAQTCVTDLEGRYGFLARPGKFKVIAKKSNYLFPSQLIKKNHDGIFTDVYRGEFFQLSDESEVVAPNIPMDPQAFDWNQQAKMSIVKTYPFYKLFVRKLSAVLFWFGLVYTSLIFFIDLYFKPVNNLLFRPSFILLLVYIFVLFLNMYLPDLRLWGRIMVGRNSVMSNASLELINPLLTGITLAKTVTDQDGRFLLRANPGNYVLRVRVDGKAGELPIRIWGEGVCNLDFQIVVDK